MFPSLKEKIKLAISASNFLFHALSAPKGGLMNPWQKFAHFHDTRIRPEREKPHLTELLPTITIVPRIILLSEAQEALPCRDSFVIPCGAAAWANLTKYLSRG